MQCGRGGQAVVRVSLWGLPLSDWTCSLLLAKPLLLAQTTTIGILDCIIIGCLLRNSDAMTTHIPPYLPHLTYTPFAGAYSRSLGP